MKTVHSNWQKNFGNVLWLILFNVINVNSLLFTINFSTESFFISFVINSNMGFEDVCTYPWIKIKFLTHRTMLLSSWSSCMNCIYLERKWHFIYKNTVSQICRNSRQLVTQMTKFYVALHHICGYWICNMFHVTFLAHQMLSWLLEFWKICGPLL
jgi:hypothetical protein